MHSVTLSLILLVPIICIMSPAVRGAIVRRADDVEQAAREQAEIINRMRFQAMKNIVADAEKVLENPIIKCGITGYSCSRVAVCCPGYECHHHPGQPSGTCGPLHQPR